MLTCHHKVKKTDYSVYSEPILNKSSNSQSFSIPVLLLWVAGKLVPISSSLLAGGGVHPGQVAGPSQGNTQTTKHTLIHTPKGNLEREPFKLTGMFLDCGGSWSLLTRKVKYSKMNSN
ncbi:hypothetical protein GOODEAATRI_029308 [Goodea atripinnis]|uniref:Uncharacterized protein n=1 Tax=Goodea atripinnis TaxID=208336 RepID=A0ABV0NYU5_9TELE